MTDFETKIANILKRHTSERFIDYKNCNAVSRRLEELLEEAYTNCLNDRFLLTASVRETLYLLRTAVTITAYADSSSGYLKELFESSLATLDLIAASAASAEWHQQPFVTDWHHQY